MSKRSLLLPALVLAGVVYLGACDTLSTGPKCNDVSNTSLGSRGDTILTASGLRFIDTQVGTGITVQSCKSVAIRLSGTLLNGTVIQRPDSFVFVPGQKQLIQGFEQGVIGMKVGGTRRLIIPPNLGYGTSDLKDNAGNTVIPGNSTLVFDIGVLDAQQ